MSFHHVQEVDDPASDGDSNHTMWLRSEGEKTESELSQAVNRSQARQVAIRFVRSLIIIIPIVCGLVLAIFASNGDPFTTAVKALKDKYKAQPVVEFTPIHYAINMAFLNITLRSQSENSVIKDIDSWKFFNEVNLKYQTEYMQPTNYSDNSKHKSLRIMISGHPGAGKTTLMRHIAKEWAEGRALQACEMLILIPLDRLSTTEQKPKSLSQSLQMSPLSDELNNVGKVSKEIQKRHGAGVCFIFDSIDRWPHTYNFVHDLFFDSHLFFPLCISTSRQIHTFRKQSNILYVSILGFNEKKLIHNIHFLTSNQSVISSIIKLWDSDSDIKDLCKLPLHMVMLIYITKLNIQQTVSIHTKTQLYSAFMNLTILYNLEHLSGWNTGSLKWCKIEECFKQRVKPETIGPASENELCTAFQHLHSVAFDMLIHKKDKFPERVEINKNIDKLGFVSVTKVESNHDEVKYTFHHPTFVEFFAAIHMLSLPQEELLYLYIKEQQSERPVKNNLWLFFFGLIGEYFNENDYPYIINIIRQFAMYHSEQYIEQFPPYCQKGRFLEYLKEIHWKGNKFSKLLSSAGVVVNSTLFTQCGEKPDTSLNTLLYTLEHHTDIHTLMLDDVGNAHTDIINMLQMMRSKHMVIHHNHCLEFNAPKNFSMYLHMILKANADYHEMMVDHLNTESFMKYMLSGNILGSLFLEENTAIDKIMKQVPPDHEVYDQQSMPPLFNMTTKHTELWKSLNGLISSLENLHQNNIEFFCETFQMLVNHLKLKKAITYIFDLKIDLGKDLGMSHEVSDSCLELVSSLDMIINQNIKLQKLTLIFPASAYFKTYRDQVIPHKLKLTGLKHLSIHLPESVMEDCYQLIDEVGEFKEIVTLEIQHCSLRPNPLISTQSASPSSILTNLPHTLQMLTLGRSGLTDEDVSVLVELRDSRHDLTSLSLPNNNITGTGLNMLVNALKSHGEITSLDLSGNPITKDLKNGSKTLSELNNLRELKLSDCSIGNITELVYGLESNLNLHSLNLSGNPFLASEHGLEPLARLTNLRHLDISGWQHRHGHRLVVQAGECIESHTHIEALEKLTKLRFLKFCSKNDPPICWSKKMASVISQLPYLQVFNAPCLVTNYEIIIKNEGGYLLVGKHQ